MKFMRRFGIIFLTFLLPVALPVTGIAEPFNVEFFGPKATTQVWDNGIASGITLPGNPAIYQISGDDTLDVALPMRRSLFDLQNKGAPAWLTTGPDTFFDIDGVTAPGLNVQALKAFVDNDANEDVVILSYDRSSIQVCYNFAGLPANCDGANSANTELPIFVDQQNAVGPISPVSAVAGDFNGDGRDDVAVAALDEVTKQGFLVMLYNNGAGGLAPFNIHTIKIEHLYAWSIASGDFNNDGREDVVVGGAKLDEWAKGDLVVMLNSGNPAPNDFEQVLAEDTIMTDCNVPTGLDSFDDGDGYTDLVVTCAFMVDMGILRGGPLKIMRKDPANARQFITEQVVTAPGEPGLAVPTHSAICDFDKDGKNDIATAIWGTKEIYVYPGKSDFEVDTSQRKVIDTAPYAVAYIECADMDADSNLDVVAVTRADLQNTVFPNVAGAQGVDGFSANLYVNQDTALSAFEDGQNLVMTESTLDAVTANQTPLQTAVQKIKASDNSMKIVVDAAKKLALTPAPVLVVKKEQLPPTNGEYHVVGAADVPHGEAVLVYLSGRPGGNIDEPDCNSTEVSYQCLPKSPAIDVQSCEVTSAEIPIAGTPATAANNWHGTVNLPAEPAQFTLTLTVTYTDTTQYVTDLQVDRSACPSGSGGGCPEQPIEKRIFDQEPFALCVSDAYSKNAAFGGKTIHWRQTNVEKSGDLLGLGPVKEYQYKNINVGGPCIEGAIFSQNWFTTEGYDLEYRTLGAGGEVGPWCPAKLIHTNPGVEGSGNCSLNKGSRESSHSFALSLGMGLALLAFLGWRHRHKLAKGFVQK